jgi:hypothetical protein
VPEQLLGPAALLVGALIAVAALWKEHLRADHEDRAQRDQAIAGWKDQTAATNRLAAALEARNRRDARQGRSDDP